ncbi:MAG TPA: HlyD family secretion protein [Victivallales bacterium]|nr:HlyD family secretion protein [Victivallales bacterium]
MKIKIMNKRYIFGIVILIIVGLLCVVYFKYKEYYPTTDDAYVKAYIVDVAPQVSGRVDHVYVKNNQWVKKGTLLFSIDSKSYKVALAEDQAKQDWALAELKSTQANLVAAEAVRTNEKYDFEREKFLVKSHSVSVREYQQVYYKYKEAIAEVESKSAIINRSKAQIIVMNQKIINDKLNLSYTNVYARVNGYVSNFSLDVGEYLSVGDKIFAIVDSDYWWVDANYRETDLARIKKGQSAKVKLDMYHHTYTGKVINISNGSGSTFSLLPPENASGNWVKITQRFSVRILVKNSKQFPLRVGASALVKVDTV